MFTKNALIGALYLAFSMSCIIAHAQNLVTENTFNFQQNGSLNGAIRGIYPALPGKLAVIGDFYTIGARDAQHLMVIDSTGLVDTTFQSPFAAQVGINDFTTTFKQFGYNRFYRHFFSLTGGAFPAPYQNKLLIAVNDQGQVSHQINLPPLNQFGLTASTQFKGALPDGVGRVWVAMYNPSNQAFFLGKYRNNNIWDMEYPPTFITQGHEPINMIDLPNNRIGIITKRVAQPDSGALFIVHTLLNQLAPAIPIRSQIKGHGSDRLDNTYFSQNTQITRVFRLSVSDKIDPNYGTSIPNGQIISGVATADGNFVYQIANVTGPLPYAIETRNVFGMLDPVRYPPYLTALRYDMAAQSTDKKSVFFATVNFEQANDDNPAIIKLRIDTVVANKSTVAGRPSLSLLPNPAQHELAIQGIDFEADIAIYNACGRCMYRQRYQPGSMFDISRLKPGIYFVDVLSRNTVNRLKLIKH